MPYTFSEMLNKIQNGKIMARQAWANGIFLMSLSSIPYIMYFVTNNSNNPCQPYRAYLADINASDWVEIT